MNVGAVQFCTYSRLQFPGMWSCPVTFSAFDCTGSSCLLCEYLREHFANISGSHVSLRGNNWLFYFQNVLTKNILNMNSM